MDNDTKLMMFVETMGGDVDIEVARDVLSAHNWNLEEALAMMTGSSGGPSQPDAFPGGDDVRPAMRTGYTDTLMAPINPAEEAALAREREAAERIRKQQEEEQRQKTMLEQAELMRKNAEKEAYERRLRKQREEVERQRAQADPEAAKRKREEEAHAEIQKQEQERERKEREERRLEEEARRLEAEAKAKEQELALQEKRRQSREAEDLQREREEAEARSRTTLVASTEKAERKASDGDDLVHALGVLRKTYKDSDPAGLVTCLKTLEKYIDNLAQNPHEAKFQRINCENPSFQSRVAVFDGAIDVLRACGFTKEGAQLVGTPDCASLCRNALTKVRVMIDHASR